MRLVAPLRPHHKTLTTIFWDQAQLSADTADAAEIRQALQLTEQILLRPRSIAIVATLVSVTCALAAIPLAAFGDDASGDVAAPSSELAELLEVREAVAQVNEQAAEQAPPAVGSRCDETHQVEGIGDTCVQPDGLLRVEQADGRSHTIHGLDAPPTSAPTLAPATQAAVANAGPGDVVCVGADQPHYTLVYARPGSVGSRYGSIAPLLRTEVYRVSAFIDGESRSVDPSAGRRLPVRCDGGSEPVVLNATLSGATGGATTFAGIVDGLRALGYEFNGDGSGQARYIVYYDSPSPTGAAGTGHVFTSDSSAGPRNQNNKGGLYSVEYRFDQGGGVPHWEVLVHEVLHTMGAVVQSAPNSTTGGHCSDGQDVMCYADSSTSRYDAGICTTRVLDCNRNDYFNPAPPAGSYLAGNWNVAASYNRYLVGHAGGAMAADVGGLVQVSTSSTAVGVSWNGAGGASYVVRVRQPGGEWRNVATTLRTTATIGGLAPGTSYEVSVASRMADGTLGTPQVIVIATNHDVDSTAPTRPGSVKVRQRPGLLTLQWGPSRDDVGVERFELRRVVRTTRGRSIRMAGRTPNTTMTIRTRGLTPGSRHTFEIVARDSAGNASAARAITVRIAPDRVRPAQVARVRALAPDRSAMTVAWTASRDDVELVDYLVWQRAGNGWVRIGAPVPARNRALRVTGLQPNATYQFRVQARDSAGNLSVPSPAMSARTRR
jgi:chitodextrinase